LFKRVLLLVFKGLGTHKNRKNAEFKQKRSKKG